MAYTNFQNCTLQEYTEVIYSEDSRNKLKIYFNGTEYSDIDLYCEKLTVTSRILKEDGNKTFGLDNFVSKEAELILHDVPLSSIVSPISLSIGSLVDKTNNTYEYVPLGIFNIQDTPETDKNKITIKLRDNSVKFDFKYNALEVIDANGGSATLLQIFNDICTTAGVSTDITTFQNSSKSIAIYDNSITARNYIMYIAEQAGCIATIDRNGKLIFVNLSQSITWQIPLYFVEKYEIGKPYSIERVVYESGVIKYETSADKTLSTLYISASNPYVDSKTQIDYILNLLSTFEIDSVNTGKVFGNPAIDPYDFIEIIDTDNNDTVIFKTLANNVLTYTGNLRQEFATEIGEEKRTENVTLTGEATFKKWATTQIDSINAIVTISTGNIEKLGNAVETLQTDTYKKTEIQQIVDGTGVDGVVVSKVITKTGYILDENGMKIYTDENSYNALHNNVGTYYKDGNTILSQTTKDGTITKDMALYGKYYYGIDENVNIENFTKDDSMFVAMLYEDDNGEECFGHFYNGN